MKKILIFCCLLFPLISLAQLQTGGNLTVFSEDGDKFFLVLNGEKQNEEAQSNLKIEDLPQPYYSAKIIFEDKTLANISKSSLMITDADGKMMDVTYKIKKDKNKKVKLVYYSMIPVPQEFMPPSGMYVRQYGKKEEHTSNNQGVQLSSGGNNGGVIDASLNVPGMNVNISISDPLENEHSSSTHHSSTITSTHQQHTQANHSSSNQNTTATKGCLNKIPMNATDFSDAKKTISGGSFDDTKMKTATSIISNNCMSTDQIISICKLFSFEENKLEFAKYAYKYATDPKNYFKVNNVFTFSASKEELSEFLEK